MKFKYFAPSSTYLSQFYFLALFTLCWPINLMSYSSHWHDQGRLQLVFGTNKYLCIYCQCDNEFNLFFQLFNKYF